MATDPCPMREHRPTLPAALDEAVLRMMRRDPAERFPNLNAALSTLEEAGGNEKF